MHCLRCPPFPIHPCPLSRPPPSSSTLSIVLCPSPVPRCPSCHCSVRHLIRPSPMTDLSHPGLTVDIHQAAIGDRRVRPRDRSRPSFDPVNPMCRDQSGQERVGTGPEPGDSAGLTHCLTNGWDVARANERMDKRFDYRQTCGRLDLESPCVYNSSSKHGRNIRLR